MWYSSDEISKAFSLTEVKVSVSLAYSYRRSVSRLQEVPTKNKLDSSVEQQCRKYVSTPTMQIVNSIRLSGVL